MTSTLHHFDRTLSVPAMRERFAAARLPDNELVDRYQKVVNGKQLSWTEHLKLIRLLGSGGQGTVFYTERRGADCFTLPLAIKIFSPEPYDDARGYEQAMGRIARVAARIATIQQDNLLDVHNFLDHKRIRMMVMEWIDGYDLAQLLVNDMLERIHRRVSARRWDYINRVIVTRGPMQPRVKPGVAVAIVRECLAALAALHRQGIVHGDVKPSNIMLKRTGNAKMVDIGSAFDANDLPGPRTCTPTYAAPEVLDGDLCTPRSDLASLGYTLIEMLAGRPLFLGVPGLNELLEAKRTLPQQLMQLLPADVTCNELLMNFCRGLVAPDPNRRFSTAEDADLVQMGAAAFQRQLVMGNLSSEYDNEIRLWLEELREAN